MIEHFEGAISIFDNQHPYTICIYSTHDQTRWKLYSMRNGQLIDTQPLLSNDDMVNFLLNSNIKRVEISPRIVDLDPRITALLVAQELESHDS